MAVGASGKRCRRSRAWVMLVVIALVTVVAARGCGGASFGLEGGGAGGEAVAADAVGDAGDVGEARGAVEGARTSVGAKPKRRKKSSKVEKKKLSEDEERFEVYNPELGEGESAIGSIHEAIDDDDMDELEDLLRWKPNLREKCQKLGETRHFVPVMKAAYLGNARALDLLLDYGANVNEIDALGYSVLMRSVMAKCVECVKLLLEAGAVVNYVQKTPLMDMGFTASRLAMIMNHREILELLRDAGADERESGAEKKRRLQGENAEQFAERVKSEGIDVDIDKLLKTTVEDLNIQTRQDADVVVTVDGKNTTMTLNETKDYSNLAEKLKQASAKHAEDAASDIGSCDARDDGECAFNPTQEP